MKPKYILNSLTQNQKAFISVYFWFNIFENSLWNTYAVRKLIIFFYFIFCGLLAITL